MARYWMPALLVGTLLLTGSSAGAARPPGHDGLPQFQKAVEAYAELHRRLERDLPAITGADNARELISFSDALATRLRAARVTAREGDVFSPAEGDAVRVLIARALYTHHYTAEEMIAAGREEAPAKLPRLAVNMRFPWAYGAAVWPSVLLALPQLPEELQYRLIGRDLVLIDVHANLVVDILRDAVRTAT